MTPGLFFSFLFRFIMWQTNRMEGYMDQVDIFTKLNLITQTSADEPMSKRSLMIAEHKNWLKNIRRERPNTATPYKVGIYIRYFNQTKYENYLDFHIKQFKDTIALCPQWELVDIYIDNGATPPNMETAPEWSRLLEDAFNGKVDLIITQKVSNVSKKMHEITFCARLLASLKHPVGMYFISEDIFTTASYYKNDLKDTFFLPDGDWKMLPEDSLDGGANRD